MAYKNKAALDAHRDTEHYQVQLFKPTTPNSPAAQFQSALHIPVHQVQPKSHAVVARQAWSAFRASGGISSQVASKAFAVDFQMP
eukprot:2969610-Prymnesium_polylepis.1